MGIDVSQFLATFYEESFEGLEIMESELLNLDVGAADNETINTIFRAAHSIKGGSGTFGLNAVSDFTHVMETLLDEMRDGRRDVTQEAVNILLSSVDVLREMLTALRDGTAIDVVRVADTKSQLDALLGGEAATDFGQSSAPVATVPSSFQLWSIEFKPHLDMLRTGNDPVRMFRELSGLGELSAEVDLSELPLWEELVPEESHISWKLMLESDKGEDAIREVFEWVDDECDLKISQSAGLFNEPVKEAAAETSQRNDSGLMVDVLEQSFNALAPKGEHLVKRFYDELFKRHPQVQPLFSKTTKDKQQTKLLAALKLVVNNLRNPDTLKSALLEMGARHQQYGVIKEHYPLVANTLLDVMSEVAGDLWTAEISQAWTGALNAIAEIMLSGYTADKSAPAASAAVETGKPQARKPAATGDTSIRVSIDKVDELINMVGELVITQSMLSQYGEAESIDAACIEKLRDGLAQLERNTRELQEGVMRIRMLPISFAFQRFPRLVHDLSSKLEKNIQLKMSGEQTELDKTVMEKIGDPLVHLVRNSLDHGIEKPDVRVAKGKPEQGTVHLNAFHQGGNIVIEIIDDGAGLNKEKIVSKAVERGLLSDAESISDEQAHDLIFHPGFSTADVVSDVSGRGVGMDVVRKNIRSLGGTVEVKSTPDVGSTFTIRLPLTLAILDGQLIKVGCETYIVPLISIIESLQVKVDRVNTVSGKGEVFRLRDEYIPIVRLYHVFGVEPDNTDLSSGLLVVVEAEGEKVALFVDDLYGQQQVVIKSLETNFKKVDGVSGATILGDGTVALILDVKGMLSLYQTQPPVPDLYLVKNNTEAA